MVVKEDSDAQVGFGTSREGDLNGSDETPDAAATRDKLNHALIQFWRQQLRDVHALNQPLVEFKNHPLPLARIKKIMKSDEDVRMISSEAPVLFAKACELFILEVSLRAWAYSEANKRRTLQQSDLVHAICNHENEVFEFLTDNIPAAAVAAANDGTAHIPSMMYAGMAGGQPGNVAGATGQPAASTSQAGMPVAMPVATSCQPLMTAAMDGSGTPNVATSAPPVHPAQPQQSAPMADGTSQPPQQYYQYVQWPGMPGQPMMMPQGASMMMPQQVMSMPGPGMSGMPAGVPQGMPMMQTMAGAVPMMQHGQPMQFVHMPQQDPKMQGQGPAPGQTQWWQGGPSGEGPR